MEWLAKRLGGAALELRCEDLNVRRGDMVCCAVWCDECAGGVVRDAVCVDTYVLCLECVEGRGSGVGDVRVCESQAIGLVRRM